MYTESFKETVYNVYYRLKKIKERSFTIKDFIEDVFKIEISTLYKWMKEYNDHNITLQIITYIKSLIGNKKKNKFKIN